MKKLLSVVLLLSLCSVLLAEVRPRIQKQQIVTVDTTGKLFSLSDNGYLSIFAQAKTYVSVKGVTPDKTYAFIGAGGNMSTEAFFYSTDKIGLLSDSGVATINFIITR